MFIFEICSINWNPSLFGDVVFFINFFNWISCGFNSGSLNFNVLFHNFGFSTKESNSLSDYEEFTLVKESVDNTGLITQNTSNVVSSVVCDKGC